MANYDRPPEPATVAIAYHPADLSTPVDRCWTWETGQTYASRGYVVRAVADDGNVATMAWAQSLYDAELARARDCWNLDMMTLDDGGT